MIVGFLGLFLISLVGVVSGAIIWGSDGTAVLLKGLGCPNGNAWVDSETYPPISYSTIGDSGETLYDCRNPHGGNACCPRVTGVECKDLGDVSFIDDIPGFDLSGTFSCASSDKIHCGDYDGDEGGCEESATIALAEYSVEIQEGKGEGYCSQDPIITNNTLPYPTQTDYCDEKINCECFWNDENQTCEGRDYTVKNCSDGTGYEVIPDCRWQITDDNGCNEGKEFMTITWTKTGLNSPFCNEGDKLTQVSCTDVVKLPFFSLLNIITIIVILIIIYYIYNSKKNKTKKKVDKKTASKKSKKKK